MNKKKLALDAQDNLPDFRQNQNIEHEKTKEKVNKEFAKVDKLKGNKNKDELKAEVENSQNQKESHQKVKIEMEKITLNNPKIFSPPKKEFNKSPDSQVFLI